MTSATRGWDVLRKLVVRFPEALVKKSPQGGGSYVSHGDVAQRMLELVGMVDFEVTEVVRGTAPAFESKDNSYPERLDAIVGCLATLTIYTIDGPTVITEVGTVSIPAMNHDGENLKVAASDAFKRCAMRGGLGLHLWTEKYYLDKKGSSLYIEE